MRFGVLGVTEVDGRVAGAPRERQVLARLLVARGGAVSADQLLDDLWRDPTSKGATASLHATVSRLRASLGEEVVLERIGPAYRLSIAGHALDVTELEDDVGAMRDAWFEQRFDDVVAISERALARFRGEPFADIADTDIGRSQRVRVEELRAACSADRAAALVELGRADALAALDDALAVAPYDERLWGLKVVALYRAGRQADALDAYESARRVLRDDLGLEPGPALRSVHAAVLAQDDASLGPSSPLPTSPRSATPARIVDLAPVSYAANGDVHIAYRTFGGGGLDVVWLPDFLFHLDVAWECAAYARFLERLATLGRLVTFDKRGQGLSDRPSSPPTLDERVADLGAVLDAVGSTRAVLVGSSEGAMVAVHRAALPDPRVAGLVLVGSTPVGDPGDGSWIFPLEDYVAWIDWGARRWGTGRTLGALAPSVADDPDAVAWYGRLERQTIGPGGVRSYGRANVQSDYRDALPHVRVPTLVLHRSDEAVPIEGSRYIADHIPGARFVEIPGTDHLVWFGDAEAVLTEIEGFVSSLRR